MAEQYLYGASVQGIQKFIFQTNELRDIVGASELVQEVCTKMFKEFVTDKTIVIVMAAGNIKCIFDNREDCERAVLEFPRKVLTEAPGITISQAVVKLENCNLNEKMQELEDHLRAQRNRPMASITTGLMAIERSRKTGLPAVSKEDGDFIDAGTKKKKDNQNTRELCKKSFGGVKDKKIAYDISEMTGKNDWIAIIHADGNGLGNVVRGLAQRKDQKELKDFSEKLDAASEEAAHAAYKAVEETFSKDKPIPLRPVVLSGDDMTIICRADLAIDYTKAFIEKFEDKMKDEKLTACAGIAFIKSSYPFYYGYELAEALCGEAKKASGRKASCLMFHKVQSSFVEDFEEIKRKELTPNNNASFVYGPYYIKEHDGDWKIDTLLEKVDDLSSENREGNAVKSDLRRWMTLLHDNPEQAKQFAERAMQVLAKKGLFKELTEPKPGKSPNCYAAYDALSLVSIFNQETK